VSPGPRFTKDTCDELAHPPRLQGFETDLHLQGTEFATLLSILYVGYILFQGGYGAPGSDPLTKPVPSNMILVGRMRVNRPVESLNPRQNKIGRPSLYIPTAMLLVSERSPCTLTCRSGG
jgi:hypothetical protein